MAMHTTHTLAGMAKALNRPAVVVSGLQTRFELPALESAAYPVRRPGEDYSRGTARPASLFP